MLAGILDQLRRNITYMKNTVIGEEFFTVRGKTILQASMSNVDSSDLGEYYLNLRRMVTHYHLWPPMTSLDKNGVTRSDFSRRGLNDIGIRYQPIGVAQYALGNFALYLDTGVNDYKSAFFAQVNWLMDNMKITSAGTAVWEFDYNFLPRQYDLTLPWISSMAQGQIISVLLRANRLTKDQNYLDAAENALKTFHRSISEGGVAWTNDEGFTFYEEYPSNPLSHVLNGHIFAMFGVYDFYRVTGSEDALSLFQEGVNTVKEYLPLYDTGFWTKYDLKSGSGCAPVRYHRIHIEQLKVLYEITGEGIFNDYLQRWESYLKPLKRARFAYAVAHARFSEYRQNKRSLRKIHP